MIRVKAVKELRYGGQRYTPGQHFEATSKHVKVLTAIKKVEVAKEKPKEQKPKEEKPVNASKPGAPTASEKAEKIAAAEASGQHNRRDMVAEGSRK